MPNQLAPAERSGLFLFSGGQTSVAVFVACALRDGLSSIEACVPHFYACDGSVRGDLSMLLNPRFSNDVKACEPHLYCVEPIVFYWLSEVEGLVVVARVERWRDQLPIAVVVRDLESPPGRLLHAEKTKSLQHHVPLSPLATLGQSLSMKLVACMNSMSFVSVH